MATDFFDSKFINESEENIKAKEAEWGNDKREKVPAGGHIMTLCKIEQEVSEQNVPIVRCVLNKDADQKTFRDMNKTFYFDEQNQEKLTMNKRMFFEFFFKAFGYTLKPGDLKGAVKQVEQFKGKKLSIAVRIRQKLYKKWMKDDEGKNTDELQGILVIDNPEIWYVESATKEINVKEERKFVKIKEADLQEYEDHKKEFPDRYDENGRLIFKKAEAATGSTSEAAGDGAPWEEEKTEPPKAEEKKQAAKPAAGGKKPAAAAPKPAAPAPKKSETESLPWE